MLTSPYEVNALFLVPHGDITKIQKKTFMGRFALLGVKSPQSIYRFVNSVTSLFESLKAMGTYQLGEVVHGVKTRHVCAFVGCDIILKAKFEI